MEKKRILYVLHNYYNRAGTEEHTRLLASGLKEDFDVFVVSPDSGRRIVLLRDEKEIAQAAVPALAWPLTQFREPAYEGVLSKVFEYAKPDLIHIQHFFNWPIEVLGQLTSFGKPVVMSFHDYYCFTPHFTMQGTDDPKHTSSSEYALRTFGKDLSEYLKARQDLIRNALKKVSRKIVPSRFLANLMSGAWPDTYEVIEHGILPFECGDKATKPDRLSFAYVGGLLPQKGYSHMAPLSGKLRERFPNTILHVFGGGALEKLPLAEGMIFHGSYSREDLPSIMSQIDVGVIPSLFLETYSLILSEYRHAGIAVAASRIGALRERVQDGVDGVLFNPGDEDDMLRALSFFAETNEWRQWKIEKPRYLDAMLEDYRALYQSLI